MGVTGDRAELPVPVQAANWQRVQWDSLFIGVVNAASTFLPVFLLRLGASANAIGLLVALPAVAAFALAIPFGRWLQARRNIVPWYSRLRLLAWSIYLVIAAVAAVLPRDQAVPVILAIWALASVPSTAALVAFPIVMDGAAGRDGRFELLGRRWAIAGVTGAVAVAVGGQFLNAVPFPLNFELLMVGISVAGFGSFLQSRRIVIQDQIPVPSTAGVPLGERLRSLARLVLGNRTFVRFELRSFVYVASIGLSLAVVPLFYVHDVAASDGWIGVIAAAQSTGAVLGYLGARQLARRGMGARALLPSLLAIAIVYGLLVVTSWLPGVAILMFVAGMAGAAAQLALFDGLMRRIPTEHGVTFSSVDQSLQNLALVIAPNVGGFLAAAIGARNSLVIVAAVSFAAVVLFGLAARDGQRGRAPEATPARAIDEPAAEVST
jgi:MFS transporter